MKRDHAELVRQLKDECIDKNLIDRGAYPQMAELETHCVRIVSRLSFSRDLAELLVADLQRTVRELSQRSGAHRASDRATGYQHT
jgi:hypothetical protein